MAKEKTIVELEKEMAAQQGIIDEKDKAAAAAETKAVALEKSLKEAVDNAAGLELRLKTETDKRSALELAGSEDTATAPTDEEITLQKNGIRRVVHTQAEAEQWKKNGYAIVEEGW